MTRLAGKKPAASAEGPAPKGAAQGLGRRELVRSIAGLCLAAGCGPTTLTSSVVQGGALASAPLVPEASGKPFGGPVEVYSWFDLPDDPRSRELSGIAWDNATRTLWAVQDETANVVPLLPDRTLRSWTFGPIIALRMTFPLDLEGIVVVPDGFIVASEKGPHILEVDRQGKLRKEIALPEHFAQARDNKSLESLTMTPDGMYLFTTSEVALGCDGASATPTAGTRLRLLRIARATGEIAEHAYATDPLPHATGDYGVADLCALSADDLLVLERGWTKGAGNTARIYRVSLTDPIASCLASPALAPESPVVAKTLLVDLAKLPARGLPAARQKQESPLLDNFEGLANGPALPDGRHTLFLVSDDNGRSDQVARILVLAVG